MNLDMLHDASGAGLYFLPADRASILLEKLAGRQVPAFRADLQGCRSATEVLGELGSAFQLPVWYGANLDALHDCLGDADWLDGQPLVLVLDGLEVVRCHLADFTSDLIEVMTSAAETRSQAGAPLWILTSTPLEGIPPLPEA